MPIQLLDQHIAELIAAGEVVERPASVVKELVENAIDAGARSIGVTIERGGIGLIRVEDDGRGIPAAELDLAFTRHATSKLRSEKDLEAIGTLGFRGEALASIASVARVELLTKNDADTDASLYAIEGGAPMGREAAARATGSTLAVRDIFYNTPARMKFLKKDASEGTFVGETVARLALSHPEISFRFIRDGREVFATPGDGSLKSAAYTVLGAAFAKELLEVAGESGPYAVRGLVTPPRAGRASRSMQFFFINGRFVKNRTMMAAMEQAYRGLTMHGRFPGGVLFLTMPPALVDVNVHPAKTEVRFAKESDVFGAVYRAVKQALAQNPETGGLQLQPVGEGEAGGEPREDMNPKTQGPWRGAAGVSPKEADGTVFTPQEVMSTKTVSMVYNELLNTLQSDSTPIPYETKGEWGLDIRPDEAEPPGLLESLRILTRGAAGDGGESPGAAQERPADAPQPPSNPPPEADQTTFLEAGGEQLRLVGEIFSTYILAEHGETLCVIDKHAAHERILYEEIAAKRMAPGAQQLLTPVTVTLSAAEKVALVENLEALEAAGFELEDYGGGEVLVRGVPGDIEPDSIADLVTEVARRMVDNPGDTTDSKTQWVLHSIACRAAVKAGDRTPPGQLLALAADILAGKVPPFCPHGRPVVLKITRKELEKQFGRLG